MESIWWLVYIILKLDAVIEIFSLLSAVCLGLSAALWVFVLSSEYDGDGEDNEDVLIKWAKRLLIMSLIFFSLARLIPTTKEALAIVGAEAIWRNKEQILEFILQYLVK